MPRRFQVELTLMHHLHFPSLDALLTFARLYALQKNANIAPLPAAGEIGTDKGTLGPLLPSSTRNLKAEGEAPRSFLAAWSPERAITHTPALAVGLDQRCVAGRPARALLCRIAAVDGSGCVIRGIGMGE